MDSTVTPKAEDRSWARADPSVADPVSAAERDGMMMEAATVTEAEVMDSVTSAALTPAGSNAVKLALKAATSKEETSPAMMKLVVRTCLY